MPRRYERKTEGYPFENLKKAIEDIRSKRITLTTASKLYSVPRTTIYNHLYEKVITKPKRGQKSIFTETQEKRLEEHILKCNQLYNILTINVVRKTAFKFAKAYNLRNHFDKASKMAGHDWYYGFMKRHPNIIVVSTRKLNSTTDGPAAFDEAEVLKFFDNLVAQDIRDNVHVELQANVTETFKRRRRRIRDERRTMEITWTHGNTVNSTDGDTMKKMAQELCKSEKNKSALRELGKQLFDRSTRKSYSPYSRIKEKKLERLIESEPEVSWNAEIVESSDPLEALAVAGPSRYSIHPTHEDTTQDKEVYDVSTPVQEPLNFDIKEEITETPEETLADFTIVSQDEVSESDSSSDVVLSRFRSEAVSGSDSLEYFKTRSIQKPKQNVTTEVLFQRYKLKSKREIDRLHSKIRELKASVAKYKRQVYRLQRRRDKK